MSGDDGRSKAKMNASVNKELLTILLGAGAMLDATDNELSCEKITNKVIAQRQRVFVNSNEKIIYEARVKFL